MKLGIRKRSSLPTAAGEFHRRREVDILKGSWDMDAGICYLERVGINDIKMQAAVCVVSV